MPLTQALHQAQVLQLVNLPFCFSCSCRHFSLSVHMLSSLYRDCWYLLIFISQFIGATSIRWSVIFNAILDHAELHSTGWAKKTGPV